MAADARRAPFVVSPFPVCATARPILAKVGMLRKALVPASFVESFLRPTCSFSLNA